MSVRIGHASIDENGKANSGVAGDQNGKEVVIRDWYTKGWNVLLRPIRSSVAEISANACEAACNNTNIGYDQYGRNTLHSKAKVVDFDIASIDTPCECDCSSLMHVCAIAGGANLSYGSNGYTTRTMVKAFVASGDYEKLTDSKYLDSDKYLKRGDILVKEGSHTAMVLDNGELAEIVPDPDNDATMDGCAVYMPVLAKGMSGDCVKVMQILLVAHGFHVPVFGKFDDRTEEGLRDFKKSFNLKDDVGCGTDTWGALLGLTGVG